MNQETFDVLVIGSGAAGLCTAIRAAELGLQVLVVEKEAVFGGTTAISGGWLWVPNTPLSQAWGHKEAPDEALEYIRHQAGPHFDEPRTKAFLENGPAAIDFLVSKTDVKFEMPMAFPDYHAEAPGGTLGGRSMLASAYPLNRLGEWQQSLRGVLPELTLWGIAIGSGKEIGHFMRATRSLKSAIYVTKRIAKFLSDKVRHGRDMTLTMGNAFAAALMKSALDRGVQLWLQSPAVELLERDGQVEGAVVQRDGVETRIHARHAVVLAAGGGPHSQRIRRLYSHVAQGGVHQALAPKGNTGDSWTMSESLGAKFEADLLSPAAWTPMSVSRRKDGSPSVFPHFFDRIQPGVIAVTPEGVRFTNEANSYHDFVAALIAACKGKAATHAWLITDRHSLRRYGLGLVKPFPFPISKHIRDGYLFAGSTIAELATRLDVDVQRLEDTLAEYNRHARFGRDPVFGRGTRAYNRALGDAAQQPNPNVRPIDQGPFYAVQLVPGDLGSFAGLRTDEHTRVLRDDGSVIEGLFAVGNDAASLMGGEYIGAGTTLGQAAVFGYVAGNFIAGKKASRSST